ncbi:NF-Y protein [Artemisia annua]|uniref:Nuclear transcription factor Y subunit n=1 Tax=Artemisia annua TaxID=35608 RepID=A0A2U1PDD8_ARTAN|nr:NF-Y protein [Artemisia annua]
MPNLTQHHLSFLLPSSTSQQSLKMVPAPHFSADTPELTHNQDSSTGHSSDQSNKDDDISTQLIHSQDQCISSSSDESYKRLEEAQIIKPILFMGNPSFGMTDHQLEKNMPLVQHAYADHYLNGLYGGYAPHPMTQPHMVHIAPARVPLPLDLSEDGPIYVNAKQYNGILRRRQIRAKLEAQNKLVKNRKPYLHESRHKHALNRVRGSGGRFLPSNKQQKSKPASRFLSSHCSSASYPSGSDHVMFSQTEHGFSSISWGNEGFLSNGDHNMGR